MADYSYLDKLTGEKRYFTAKTDETIVKFNLPNLVDKTKSQEFLYSILPEHKSSALLSNRIDRDLPILIDQDKLERYFLPDECTVQFRENIGKTKINEIVEKCNCSISVKQGSHNYYTLKLSKDKDVFHSIRDLSDFAEVEFAAPSEMDADRFKRPYYSDKLTGKQYLFIPKDDELVIVFEPDDTANNSLSNFEILDLTDETASVPPDAAQTFPAMIDNDGLTRYFLLNECTVQFKETISEGTAKELLKKKGYSVLSEQRTPGYYIVSVPEDQEFFVAVQQLMD
ncbi:hypothetical protein [Crocosphaera chwakensis]|uniref:Uncharacterized protein n=1 Tax=Crocosphaera chwakensis CCY0110 TaxID=391612 RepID=A3IZY4_9CHRO|nr:hypothetical protein [Crocosphaera chwakensis]EAZ87961.1 hypothetical protein CY0110_02727 [Crocosphaera chwakensis CCY0110]